MKPLLIVNPRSGGGRTGGTWTSLQDPLSRYLGQYDVAITERPRHAAELAEAAAKAGRETIIAVGGDGTIHEIVNGMMRARDDGAGGARLGIIGQGTGGDFRKSIGLEHRLSGYAQTIADGKTRAVDVGRIDYQVPGGGRASGFFINILSVGIGGLVDRYVSSANRSLGGKFAYFAASLRGLIESEVGHLHAKFRRGDEQWEEEIATRSIAICNGQYFGSGMHIAPMASVDDGLFDVIDLGDAGRARFAAVSSRMYTGKHLDHADVRHFQADHVDLTLRNTSATSKFLLDVDGEPLGELPLTVSLERSAIEVFVP